MARPWRDAIGKLRHQLGGTCLIDNAARRRFQNGQLIDNLFEQFQTIAAERRYRDKVVTALVTGYKAYSLFCGSPWQENLGYNEARKQHLAELDVFRLPAELKPWKDEA